MLCTSTLIFLETEPSHRCLTRVRQIESVVDAFARCVAVVSINGGYPIAGWFRRENP